MPDSSDSRSNASVSRRDIFCGAVGAATAAVTATAVVALASSQNRVEVATSAQGIDVAPSQQPESDLQRELGLAKEREQKALQELNVARLREDGRSKANEILRAPIWTWADFNEFLASLAAEELLSTKKALKILKEKATIKELKGSPIDMLEIKRQVLWFSSHILEYGFKDPDRIAYHQLVTWVATAAGVPNSIVNSQSTFVVERALCEQMFVGIWDKLNQGQRMDLLSKVDPDGSAGDHIATAALGGSAALAALSTTVYFAGFAFYTTMSITICTVAGWFGLTLPFAAYTGASSLVAFLSGPVGWAVIALGAAVGIAMAGRANLRESTAAIVQIHVLKVAALERARNIPADVFNPVGRGKTYG